MFAFQRLLAATAANLRAEGTQRFSVVRVELEQKFVQFSSWT
jgi:hypothetical protein